MDEFEAVRLADFSGLRQKDAAKSMHISQQTFSRILRRARKRLADAIVNGKIIKIQGGSYVISTRFEAVPERQTRVEQGSRNIPKSPH
jgi:predicted DNA-binding protein (UPF0251 family)